MVRINKNIYIVICCTCNILIIMMFINVSFIVNLATGLTSLLNNFFAWLNVTNHERTS